MARSRWMRLLAAHALYTVGSIVQSSSSISTATTVTTAETLAQEWFTDNFDDNETQLAVGVNSALNNLSSSDVMCYGVPSVQRRTEEATPNGGCPDIFTAVNASCSCLSSGYSDVDAWEFHVTLRTDEGSDSYPTALTSADVLAIDSIRTLLVPSSLTTLRIIGEGTYPQTITFVPQDEDLPGSTLPIATVKDGSIAITTVSLENIDMSSITQTASTFYPSTTLNITLRNCNMIKFGFNFFDGLDNVQYLNLTNNSISTFPTVVFNVDNLQELRVAIKKIRPDRSASTAEIEQFLKEIIMMAVLYHPRIVEFVGVAWDNLRHLSAVTEFMDNGDLRDVLHGYKLKGERLSWESHKATIALHIAEALSYLHTLKPKIIHRDLKSKNVLLNMYLEAKLSDFGIARMRYLVETHMTAGVGTSFWIAPEVLLGQDYNEAADIYSFGVVLSEIDTDDYPYWNDENKSNRGKIQEAEILSLVAEGKMRPSFTNDCPKAILDLADCCLQKDPVNRPTAAEIVVILEHMIHASERSSSSLQSGVWSVTTSDEGNNVE
ncbi:TKL protein kinase [Phytophthora cinnamomi]|uniref:TKL protein kinase n=1 Tax=Phytophthora cinnamomi TaxID=4785 RepID=UPI00355A8E6B|nr:TKL protein kinase [Phytophthora cinnamomi]